MKINLNNKTAIKSVFICAIIVTFTLSACRSSGSLSRQKGSTIYCSDSSLMLFVKKITASSTDSIMVDLVIENRCADSVIIMRDYTKPQFYFPNGGIQSSSIQTTLLYPSIDWSKSTKEVKEIYIKNKCNPLINQHDIFFIPPNESKLITYNLNNLGYRGFVKNVKYDFFASLDVSSQIKSYCPFVWAGFTKSSLYSFIIQ